MIDFRAGGAITHHPAMGAMTARGTTGNALDAYAQALDGRKRALDPRGTVDPGALVDV